MAPNLIASYLKNRKQYVSLNEFSSKLKTISTGVPQGSILGPLLFSVYINDLHTLFQKPELSLICYADDTSLLVTGKSTSEIETISNRSLYQLLNWTKPNALTINLATTKAILFRPKNKIVTSPKITLGTEHIEVVEYFKVLGVHLSSTLSWDKHVEAISKKVYQTVGIINKHRFVLPERIKLFLYNSLILPHIRYAHLVWGTTTMKNLNTLYLLQKRVVRIIANVPFLDPTAELFRQYRIIKANNFYD